MTLRALLWTAHRWVGLVLLAPFLVLIATGSALIVCRTASLGGAAPLVEPATNLAGFDRAVEAALARAPGAKPGLVLPGVDPRHAWSLQLRAADGATSVAEFDPAHGVVLWVRPSGASLEETLLSVHNSLALGATGRLLALSTAVGATFLAGSGFLVMRRRWRVLTGSPLAGPLRLRSLHQWTGLAAFAFVAIWATSGFMLLATKMGGGNPGPKPRPVAAPICAAVPTAQILNQALLARPGDEIQGVVLDAHARPIMVMLLDRSAPPWAKSTSLALDACTGAPRPARSPPGMKLMVAAKALHTGLWGSGLTAAFYAVMAATTLILTLTGPWLWLRRRLAQKAKP